MSELKLRPPKEEETSFDPGEAHGAHKLRTAPSCGGQAGHTCMVPLRAGEKRDGEARSWDCADMGRSPSKLRVKSPAPLRG